jgi:hypothetical protein
MFPERHAHTSRHHPAAHGGLGRKLHHTVRRVREGEGGDSNHREDVVLRERPESLGTLYSRAFLV